MLRSSGTMTKCFRTIVFIVLLLAGRTSYADQISVGDLVRFGGSNGELGGGAFLIDNTANGPGLDFLTFCIQMTQYLDYSNLFRVGSITGYADDAGGPDYIAPETAWIFSNFRSGALDAYTSDEVQAAIWKLEGEWTTNIGQSMNLISLAQVQVAAGWLNTEVSVLNLFYTDGRLAQDQLVLSPLPEELDEVPEPATLALLGVGAFVLARKRRRSNRP
jgi:hypothetical protein